MSGAAGGKTSSFSSSAPAGVQDLVEQGIISQTGSDVPARGFLLEMTMMRKTTKSILAAARALSLPSSMMNSDEDFIIGNTDDGRVTDLRKDCTI